MLRSLLLALMCSLGTLAAGAAEHSSTELPAKPPASKQPAEKEKRPPKKAAGAGEAFRIYSPIWSPPSPPPGEVPDLVAHAGVAEAAVLAQRTDEAPLLLFVAIDFSDDLILTESAKESLAKSIKGVKPNVYTSLLRIPEQPMVLVDPTQDREPFIEGLRTLPMSGRAGFFEMVDVVSSVTEPLVRKYPVRVAVLYVTDSEISRYRSDYTNPVINSADSRDLSRRFPDALIREKVNTLTSTLVRTSVPLFVVHLRYRSDTLNEAYQTGLRRLAETTGGRAVFCRSIADIPTSIADMLNTIQAMKMVEVEVPGKVTGSFSLSLESGAGPLQHRTLFQRPR